MIRENFQEEIQKDSGKNLRVSFWDQALLMCAQDRTLGAKYTNIACSKYSLLQRAEKGYISFVPGYNTATC